MALWPFPLLNALYPKPTAELIFSIRDHTFEPKYTGGTIETGIESILLKPTRERETKGVKYVEGRVYLYPAYDVEFDIIFMKENRELARVPLKANRGWRFDVGLGSFNGYAIEGAYSTNQVTGFAAGKYFAYDYGYQMYHGYSADELARSGYSNDTLYRLYHKTNMMTGIGNVREFNSVATVTAVPDSIIIKQTKPLYKGDVVEPLPVEALPPTKPEPKPPLV